MPRLPLVPHCDLDPDCCDCLFEVMEEDGSHFICNECSAIVSKDDVARIVIGMEYCRAKCPRCGSVNEVHGFSKVSAFVCRRCGEGVAL